ncbi:MAG: FtsX-like permease family protein [Anaerolineaceae bacterium]|nr:FtsX-like permease family protein [Anaerolineaceae bacterium]
MLAYKSLEIIRLGLRSLKQHALRSVLTMLGILCGVSAVISMLAIGEGTSLETQEQFRRLGATNIILRSVKPADTSSSGRGGFAIEYGLTYMDAERIKSTLPDVDVVVPQRRIPCTVRYRHRKMRADVVGTVPWASSLTNAEVARGRFLTEIDERRSYNYCVLGSAVARELFAYEDPIGQAVRIGASYYRVVGVMAARGRPASGAGGNSGGGKQTDFNREIYIPLSTARTWFGETIMDFESGSRSAEKVELHEIQVHCKSVDQVVETSRAVRALIERYHKKADYTMTVPLEQIRAAEESGRRFSIMLGAIAAISLLVGGIGIMNIMLASVTERTREIGVRRALGARKRDIVMQFLVETVVISFLGGLAGLGAGYFIAWAIEYFADQTTVVTAWSLLLSVSISLTIGLVFGIYPAWRAAQLDPIKALRHE